MLRPTLSMSILRKVGNDLRGQPRLCPIGSELFAPVKLEFSSTHSTVRTDSSGSRGAADEAMGNVIILCVPATKVRLDDQLVIDGHQLRVTKTHKRYTPTGVLDHVQVWCELWA
jgi:hypothetical protein